MTSVIGALGAGCYVWTEERKLLIDFASVDTTQLFQRGLWDKLSTSFLFRGGLRKIRIGKQLRAEFVAAMRSQGAAVIER